MISSLISTTKLLLLITALFQIFSLHFHGVIHIFFGRFLWEILFEKQERACTCKLQTQVRTMGPSLKWSLDQNKQVSEGPMLLTCVWSLHVHARSCFSNKISQRKFRMKMCMTDCKCEALGNLSNCLGFHDTDSNCLGYHSNYLGHHSNRFG